MGNSYSATSKVLGSFPACPAGPHERQPGPRPQRGGLQPDGEGIWLPEAPFTLQGVLCEPSQSLKKKEEVIHSGASPNLSRMGRKEGRSPEGSQNAFESIDRHE